MPYDSPLSRPLRLRRVILREVLMAVCVVDRLVRIRLCQRFGTGLAVNVVISAAVVSEVRLFVDNRSSAGVSASATGETVYQQLVPTNKPIHSLGGRPESTTEVDITRSVRINISVGARISTTDKLGSAIASIFRNRTHHVQSYVEAVASVPILA